LVFAHKDALGNGNFEGLAQGGRRLKSLTPKAVEEWKGDADGANGGSDRYKRYPKPISK